MDETDIQILDIVQKNGRASSAEIAELVGVSVSTANERVRKLSASGYIKSWHAILESNKVGAKLCAFIFVDIEYEGEKEACDSIKGYKEVMEFHHVSGARSYLLKVRVENSNALHRFIVKKIKPLVPVVQTESIVVLNSIKESTEMEIHRS